MAQNQSGGLSDSVRWWEARLAQNRKPTTYSCPLCGELLPALGQHMLLFPEGDRSRRRHAHTECVMRARAQGRLPSRDEWERAQRERTRRPDGAKPSRPRWLSRFRKTAGTENN
jgi:hypothetical protein